MKHKQDFWVTNISDRNVSLADLNLTIKAYTSVNLLDSKHYYYTLEQVIKSVQIGSISKKQDKIVVRKNAPEIVKNSIQFDMNSVIPSRERSVLNIKEERYEELNISDEQFAEESAEIADLDTKPLIIKEKNHVTSTPIK
jgi:hypothetical protein